MLGNKCGCGVPDIPIAIGIGMAAAPSLTLGDVNADVAFPIAIGMAAAPGLTLGEVNADVA